MQTVTILMCYFKVLCGLNVLYWRKDNKADIKNCFICNLFPLKVKKPVTNFKIQITGSTKRIFSPLNLLSFIHGNSDTQVGWKVAKFFSSLDSGKIFRRKGNQPFWWGINICSSNLIPTNEHRSTRVIHSNAQLSKFAISIEITDQWPDKLSTLQHLPV